MKILDSTLKCPASQNARTATAPGPNAETYSTPAIRKKDGWRMDAAAIEAVKRSDNVGAGR